MIVRADSSGRWPLADGSVQCIVTSPPYWGLRDYGVEGQLGSERTWEGYLERMLGVFAEAWRVLRADGTLWLNMGDAYAGSWGAQSREHAGKPGPNVSAISANQVKAQGIRASGTGSLGRTPGLKVKDLIGMPWRLAFALQAAGALDPRAMARISRLIEAITESYSSREEWPAPIAREVALLEAEYAQAKMGSWWLRQDNIWHKPNPMPESVTDRPTRAHEYVFLLSKSQKYYYDYEAVKEGVSGDGRNDPNYTLRKRVQNGEGVATSTLTGTVSNRHTLGEVIPEGQRRNKQRGHGRRHAVFNARWDGVPVKEQGANGRNLRSVWTVATRPAMDEEGVTHFAAFPPELIKPCILAGCPKGGIVLDPFVGTGTTVRVAQALGRRGVGLELNPDYARLARRNLSRGIELVAEAMVVGNGANGSNGAHEVQEVLEGVM